MCVGHMLGISAARKIPFKPEGHHCGPVATKVGKKQEKKTNMKKGKERKGREGRAPRSGNKCFIKCKHRHTNTLAVLVK